MPEAVEKALKKVARKYAKRGKLDKDRGESSREAINHFVYGTMTNMQKKGSIGKWRKLK